MESPSSTNLPVSANNSWLRRLGNALFRPHASIKGIAEQRKATLTLILTLALTFTNGISLIFVGRIGLRPAFVIQILLTLAAFVAYLLGRRPQPIWGSILIAAALSISGFANIMTGSDKPDVALYTTIPLALVIGSALLPVWGNALQYGLDLAAMVVLPLLTPIYTYSLMGTNMAVIFTLGLLLIAVQVFRDGVERAQLAEVQAINRDLREMGSSLEQRVAARTRDLATVASISNTTTAIRDPQPMLETLVHLTQRGFNLYHAHVFTFDRQNENLQIAACGWQEGDEHQGTHGTTVIPLAQEQSLVARAARTHKPVIVNDVRSDPDWLPNPLLPDTRAEIAVPMLVGNELLGVLDVQSDQVEAFSEQDANIQLTLASQVATALQSAQAYAVTRERAELETMINAIGLKIQASASVEETLQTAVRELGQSLGARRASVNLSNRSDNATHPG